VELDLTQIFLVKLLCMAVVELAQVHLQVPYRPVEEVMTIHRQQIEAAVDHNQEQIVGLPLQVQQVL
jgi:hypothetical protein